MVFKTNCKVLTGLWQVADLEREGGAGLDPERANAALLKYYHAGFTTIDMADHCT
jgi:hypothetical protein